MTNGRRGPSRPSTRRGRTREASAQRRERERKSTEALILEEARHLLVERGYPDFSLREVAERIGYSATTIYRYFENRDDLVLRILRGVFGDFNRALYEALAGHSDPWERLFASGRAYARFALERPEHYRLMFMERCDLFLKVADEAGPPAAPDPDTEDFKAGLYAVRDVIAEGMSSGVFREGDAEGWSHFLWAHLHGIVALHIGMDDAMDQAWVEGMVVQMERVVRSALEPVAGSAGQD